MEVFPDLADAVCALKGHVVLHFKVNLVVDFECKFLRGFYGDLGEAQLTVFHVC